MPRWKGKFMPVAAPKRARGEDDDEQEAEKFGVLIIEVFGNMTAAKDVKEKYTWDRLFKEAIEWADIDNETDDWSFTYETNLYTFSSEDDRRSAMSLASHGRANNSDSHAYELRSLTDEQLKAALKK